MISDWACTGSQRNSDPNRNKAGNTTIWKKKKQNPVFYQTREAKYSFLIDSKLNTAELMQAFSGISALILTLLTE